MQSNFFQPSIVVLTLGLSGCVGTSLDSSLKSPSYHGGAVQKVAVVAVTHERLVREGFENRFARQMMESGQGALVTYDLLSLPEIKADKPAATARFRQAGADSVLVIRLANQATQARETQATANIFVPVIAGYGYNDWYDYYSVSFMNMGTSWSDSKTEVYLESSLYDLKTSQRIWAGGTVTVLKDSMDRVEQMNPIVSKVLGRLAQRRTHSLTPRTPVAGFRRGLEAGLHAPFGRAWMDMRSQAKFDAAGAVRARRIFAAKTVIEKMKGH